MNFYRFKLALARLKLTYIPDTRYIYFIFLEPITDQDLHKEIYFIIFFDLNPNIYNFFKFAGYLNLN
jgi:hypothetical protein